MYTIEAAAKMLGVSIHTVRRWIKDDGIKVEKLRTDRDRVYLTYNDMRALASKHRPLNMALEPERKYPDVTDLYSVLDAARVMGVDKVKIRRWIRDMGIEKKIVTTDKSRVYISYSDLVAMANKYNHTILYEPGMPMQVSSTVDRAPSVETKLYTLAQAALFLGVAEPTVKDWVLLHNVEQKVLETDKDSVYITYSAVMMLAKEYPHRGRHPLNLSEDMREVRNRLEKVEASIVSIENLIKEHRNYDKLMGYQ